MRILYLAALALLAPAIASAQTARSQPVTLEIVATGEIDAPANSLTVPVTYTVQGETQEAAEKAKAAKYAELLKVLKDEGIPASALGAMDDDDPAKLTFTSPTVVTTATPEDYQAALAEADAAAAAATDEASSDEPAQIVLNDGHSLKLTTLAQVKAVRDALSPLDITVGAPVAALDDPASVQRQAKAKALGNARADANAYAAELGLRVTRVSRISEAGNNLMLPGLQDIVRKAMSGGPQSMRKLFESKPGTVHVAETIIVEFVLAP